MEKWYLLYCKRDQVLRAIEHLERQGVTVHNPTYKTEKMVRNRRKKVMEPLFPNYLFVKFDYEVIHFSTIGSTRGVNYFVRFGQNPVVVPNEVIATLVVPDFVKEMSDNLPQKGMKSSLQTVFLRVFKQFITNPMVKRALFYY